MEFRSIINQSIDDHMALVSQSFMLFKGNRIDAFEFTLIIYRGLAR